MKKLQPFKNGGVAQLGEHLPCKQGVMGSNPIISTKEQKFHLGNEGIREIDAKADSSLITIISTRTQVRQVTKITY